MRRHKLNEDELKNISGIKVNKSCWKKLRNLSTDREVPLAKVAKEILESYANKKLKHTEELT